MIKKFLPGNPALRFPLFPVFELKLVDWFGLQELWRGRFGGRIGTSRQCRGQIDGDGDEATCWLIYTNVLNESIEKPPQFLEQGRDYTKLVKRDGRWLIKHRWVTSDGGAPEYWRQKYIKRSFR